MVRCCLLLLVAVCLTSARVLEEEGLEGSCAAGASCAAAARSSEYPWPTARGRAEPGLYSISPYKAPKDWEKKLAWTFSGIRSKGSTIFNGGVAIDHQGNIYTAAVDAIYKLNEFGTLLWSYSVMTHTVPVIDGGALYSSSNDGRIFALDMATGLPIWDTQVSSVIGVDIASAGVSDGVVITSTHGFAAGGDSRVTAVNASTGRILWEFSSHAQLWNFMPIFTGSGSFVFQDQIGGVYHLRTATGELLWKAGYTGGWAESWTDGLCMLGPNGLVYAVHADCTLSPPSQYPMCWPLATGSLRAYRLSSGELVWEQATPYAPNSQPLVAEIGSRLSVVMPIAIPAGPPPSLDVFTSRLPNYVANLIFQLSLWLGDKQAWLWGRPPHPSMVRAYDAETGAEQWTWHVPPLVRGYPTGDEELFMLRIFRQSPQPLCVPNLWASPTMDANGTIFLGHGNGKLYALRDDNGNGKIDVETEVTAFDTGVAFSHPGLGMGPRFIATVNCDGVHVFREPGWR